MYMCMYMHMYTAHDLVREKCELLSRELWLSGTFKEIIQSAAEQLGVETAGRPLMAIAESCVVQLERA